MDRINIAYIDATNLDKALRNDLGWKLDYKSFRTWLGMKYATTKAYMFMGFIPRHKDIYNFIVGCGFEIIFKEVVYQHGKPKGNCDSDLIVQALVDLYEGELDRAIIVPSSNSSSKISRLK